MFRMTAFALLVVASPDVLKLLAAPPTFLPGQVVGKIGTPIVEASGLAISRVNEDVFWYHNDFGDGPNIYATNPTGAYLGVFRLSGTDARDWEDMAIGPGPLPDQSYLYLGDIGDNREERDTIRIHRVAEPAVNSEQAPVDVTLPDFETIVLKYPDGPHDAETLMVDPVSGDVYVVSKRDAVPRIYRAPYPQPTSETVVLESVGQLSWTIDSFFDMPTSGAISPDGDEVLIRSYVTARIWSVAGGTNIGNALATPGYEVPLALQQQGEAIAFSTDGQDYYAVSEGNHTPIWLYERGLGSTLYVTGEVYTVADGNANSPSDGFGDIVVDQASRLQSSIGEVDTAIANSLVRAVAKFQLPEPPGNLPALKSAVLRFFLNEVKGAPAGPASLFHSVADNDSDMLPSDYEDDSYRDTMMDLVQPTDSQDFFDLDVTSLVLEDYAEDGSIAMSAFRLQVEGATFEEDNRSHGYVFFMPALESLQPKLVLTFVPEPRTIVLAMIGLLGSGGFVLNDRSRPEANRTASSQTSTNTDLIVKLDS